MLFRRVIPAVAALLLAGLAQTHAQNDSSGELQASCQDKFVELRTQAEKRFGTVKSAISRKAPAVEQCRLIKSFTEAESKMIKYIEEQGIWCGFPAEALAALKANQVQSQEYRKQACAAAAQPRPTRPAGPTLSDALTPPVSDENTTRTGRGTLDSLGGNPLAR
ncbi:MAG: hypothetical protein WD073_06030 [Xanthobacteraceae bacterium]